MKNKEFIYKYWDRTNIGREIIASNCFSESDLLFLIPNNVKKVHGLPCTRMSGKKKRKQKVRRKIHILSSRLFKPIEEVVEETLGSKFSNNKFFKTFVEVKK